MTVSSIGNAKSLKGGTLVMTPLKGADGQVYAMAQGNLVVVGAGASGGGSKAQINHLSVGRVPGGATVEREVPSPSGRATLPFRSARSNFGTVATRGRRHQQRHRCRHGHRRRCAADSRQAPLSADERVAFLGTVEELDVIPRQTAAKVIVNTRTGSVVMNQTVTLENCAVAHGNLSVAVSADRSASRAHCPAVRLSASPMRRSTSSRRAARF